MFRLMSVLVLASLGSAFAADRSTAPKDAYVYFITPAHGEVIPAHSLVRFGLSGMGVAPAGVERSETGHHHLLIDQEELPPADEPIPSSEKIIHFGKGQTEAWITLPPGTHTLQMVLGNHHHVMHRPIIKSRKITVTVPEPAGEDKEEKQSGLPGLFR